MLALPAYLHFRFRTYEFLIDLDRNRFSLSLPRSQTRWFVETLALMVRYQGEEDGERNGYEACSRVFGWATHLGGNNNRCINLELEFHGTWRLDVCQERRRQEWILENRKRFPWIKNAILSVSRILSSERHVFPCCEPAMNFSINAEIDYESSVKYW